MLRHVRQIVGDADGVDTGCKAQIVGINGTKEAVDAIKAGKMLATGDYNGFVQGCIGTEIALRYLRHEPVPNKVTQPSVVVQASNIGPYDVPVDQRQCPAWDEIQKN